MRRVKARRAFFLVGLSASALIAGASQSLEFKRYGRGTFQEIREVHAGRALVVHFWSATCAPCLAELPDWARIAQEKKGVDIVFVNADGEGERVKAGARLETAGLAGAINYIFADDFLDRVYFEVDPGWRGELPFTAMIDGGGKLEAVAGTIEEPAIAGWLAKASP